MKAIIHRESFLAAFSQAAAVAPTRSPKDVLNYIFLEASDGQASLTATDLEQAVRIPVNGCEVDQPGVALLPISRFGTLLKECPDERLRLDTDSRHNLVVRGERSQHRLATVDPDEFPRWEERAAESEQGGYHEIASPLLLSALQRTVFATDEENARYALSGVMLELTSTRLIAVGTDGRRLATMEGPAISRGQEDREKHVVPNKGVKILSRLLADCGLPARITLTSNWIRCEVPDRFIFRSRLLEGLFPRWRDAIPGDAGTAIALVTGPLDSAIRQVLVSARTDSPDLSPAVTLAFLRGTLTITAESELGTSQVELPAPYDSERPLSVSLNPMFLREFLRVLSAEDQVILQVVDSETAVKFTDGGDYLYIVMPVSRGR
jgi:DNA polymerase-3 subunit beta